MWRIPKEIIEVSGPEFDKETLNKAVDAEIKNREELAERKAVAKAQAVKNLAAAKKQNTKLIADAKKKLCPYIDGQKLCVAGGCHAWEENSDIVDGELVWVTFSLACLNDWQNERVEVDMGGHCNFKGVIK